MNITLLTIVKISVPLVWNSQIELCLDQVASDLHP